MSKVEIDSHTKAILIQAAATLSAARSSRLATHPGPQRMLGMIATENAKLSTTLKEVIAAFDGFDELREGTHESLTDEVIEALDKEE